MRAWDEYTKAGGTGTMMELIHIHLLFSAGKEEEACFLLDRMEQQRNHLTAPEQQGYFLYLTTFYNKDKKYIDYVEEKLGRAELYGIPRTGSSPGFSSISVRIISAIRDRSWMRSGSSISTAVRAGSCIWRRLWSCRNRRFF